jgi:hypothetical protein
MLPMCPMLKWGALRICSSNRGTFPQCTTMCLRGSPACTQITDQYKGHRMMNASWLQDCSSVQKGIQHVSLQPHTAPHALCPAA